MWGLCSVACVLFAYDLLLCFHLVFPDGPAAGQQDGGNPDEKGDSCKDDKGERDCLHIYFYLRAKIRFSRVNTVPDASMRCLFCVNFVPFASKYTKFFLFLNLV